MDILKELEDDIRQLNVQIDKINKRLAQVHEEDIKSQSALVNQLNQLNNSKTAKQRLYHDIKQDLELKNEETRARISKLLGTGAEIEDISEIYREIYGVDE